MFTALWNIDQVKGRCPSTQTASAAVSHAPRAFRAFSTKLYSSESPPLDALFCYNWLV